MPFGNIATWSLQHARHGHLRAAGVTVWIALLGTIQTAPVAGQSRHETPQGQSWRGVVRAVHQASFSTELVTPVAAIGAREGHRFKAGDRLIEFDCKRQHHELSALVAAVREAQVTHESNLHLLRNGASNRSDVAIAAARFDKARAEHAALKQRLGGCLIAAPFDGIVVELGINTHELPTPNKPLMTIVSDRQLEIEIIVPSRALSRLGAGVHFEFTVDETQRVYRAAVLRTGGAVDPVSQTAKVYAAFTVVSEDVVPGMSGTAVIETKESR
jgi:membrane fusion protein, multidrug efflux system